MFLARVLLDLKHGAVGGVFGREAQVTDFKVATRRREHEQVRIFLVAHDRRDHFIQLIDVARF